mmetsp:Transcript_29446/g.49716  ORF Transcript_29446/g.49716 Transcript_29446/m.49716 type:complete len:206 (+) Transcript_29446:768-1385(+)
MWSAIVMVPVRQLIRIGVTVIEEFTLLTDNAARVLIGLPLVDTRGVVAQQLLVYFHRGVDVRALRNRIHTLIVDPTVAVRGHFPASIHHGHSRFGIALQSHSTSKHGARLLLACEETMQSPESRPGAVVVKTLHVGVPLSRVLPHPNDFGEQVFGGLISVEQTVLGALLVVDHKLQSHLGAIGPFGIRRMLPVASNIARSIGGII